MPLKFVDVTPETKPVSDDGFVCTCLRCGAQWVKRTLALPKSCANKRCHSVYWDTPKTPIKPKKQYTSIWDVQGGENERKEENAVVLEQKQEIIIEKEEDNTIPPPAPTIKYNNNEVEREEVEQELRLKSNLELMYELGMKGKEDNEKGRKILPIEGLNTINIILNGDIEKAVEEILEKGKGREDKEFLVALQEANVCVEECVELLKGFVRGEEGGGG